MLVHDRFVFLQMRKTASTFLVDALEDELPDGSLERHRKHAPWGEMPSEAAERPVLAFVRNPWDWYTSWYHFNRENGGQPNGFWIAMSQAGELDFPATMRNAFQLGFAIMGGDLYSTLFRNLVGDGLDSSRLTVGRFESLIDDFERFLDCAGVELPDGAIDRIRLRSPLNASVHEPYREYYDEGTRDLVATWCRPLIERFGYEF